MVTFPQQIAGLLMASAQPDLFALKKTPRKQWLCPWSQQEWCV